MGGTDIEKTRGGEEDALFKSDTYLIQKDSRKKGKEH